MYVWSVCPDESELTVKSDLKLHTLEWSTTLSNYSLVQSLKLYSYHYYLVTSVLITCAAINTRLHSNYQQARSSALKINAKLAGTAFSKLAGTAFSKLNVENTALSQALVEVRFLSYLWHHAFKWLHDRRGLCLLVVREYAGDNDHSRQHNT